ncbi:MAG TPA: hypothetical protein VGM03_14470, partial [Phycisphaerae bacterium]
MAVPYIVGIGYDLSWLSVLDESTIGPALTRDFSEIKRLGFNTVFVGGGQPAAGESLWRPVEWERTWTAAQRSGLLLAWEAPGLSHYVATGQLPPGRESIDALLAALPSAVNSRTRNLILDLGIIAEPDSAQRLSSVTDRLGSAGASLWTFARLTAETATPAAPVLSFWALVTTRRGDHIEPAPTGAPAPLLALSVARRRPVLEASPARQGEESERGPGPLWLAAYHAGLARGYTGG